MTAWLAVLLAGAGSYAFRLGAVALLDRFALPGWFDRVSALILPAVFAALAAGSLAAPAVEGARTAVPVLAGAVVTAAVARRRSAATGVLAGMSALCAAQLLLATLGS
jgi:branched-subunit amino acid transport protein